MQRLALTLVELLAVIGIIVALASLLLVAVVGTQQNYEELQTRSVCGDVTRSILLFAESENSLPAPDNDYYIEVDWTLDDNKTSVLKDFDNWPVLNKLVFKHELAFDHELLHETGSGDRRRLQDAYGQDIRYVLGDGVDDNGHQVEGQFDDWNWNPTTTSAIKKPYPYVYSYGPDNEAGTQFDLWIYSTGAQ